MQVTARPHAGAFLPVLSRPLPSLCCGLMEEQSSVHAYACFFSVIQRLVWTPHSAWWWASAQFEKVCGTGKLQTYNTHTQLNVVEEL